MSLLLAVEPQIAASDPDASAFVTANAGAGKTWTLVARVARLLLRGAEPDTILCVTYTKAAAAEMQIRLFDVLGGWAIADNETLGEELKALDEQVGDLARARRLFARALETPGGLKIQTIHAFCEMLLKRFPLEARVSPTFRVLEEIEAGEVAQVARDRLAEVVLDGSSPAVSAAYEHFAVELDFISFNEMFADFATRRPQIKAYADACGDFEGLCADVWRRCGFSGPVEAEVLEAAAVTAIDWAAWRNAAAALAESKNEGDRGLGERMAGLDATASFESVWAPFATKAGEARKNVCTQAVAPAARAWLVGEQTRLEQTLTRAKSARVAGHTIMALTLALAFGELYEGQKTTINALDFGDLIEAVRRLITERPDAAWVLYKLDRGIEHVLLDEAQDTAPEQWDILRDLTEEFFSGAGLPRKLGAPQRTVFAVGDEKQSIYSFQGAHPERLRVEAKDYRGRIEAAGLPFVETLLEASRRSTPEVLAYVDAVFADPGAAAGLSPGHAATHPYHRPLRDAGFGAVDVWPPLESDPSEMPAEWWTPVDAHPGETGARKLARRIAQTVSEMIRGRAAVFDKEANTNRPATAGDFLILVRRRSALFHEIIRALKAAGVPSGGADRLALSEHIAFKDLIALGCFVRFPDDDLTLAVLLKSPFCDVNETALFDLAHQREHSLWGALTARAGERPEWGAALAFLAWARSEADARAPFDFYARVLSRLDGAGRAMRGRLFARLGREAEDAVDAFMAEALNLERRRVRDLERFLDEMKKTELEVKREPEQAYGEVRVMTVHGAKGLEAPIVILPDTTTKATSQGGPLLEAEDGGFLWSARKSDDGPASRAARSRRDLAVDEESLRLFYVAMTRARDRLIVCGVAKKQRGSW
ncbi:MAG TPA: double-strand break repair helicase AddA, partial [Caulobacteraceae bacterium]|nr:double-strand break repair helicase AddA [Caulobacteraceae bacterium]